MKSSEIVAITSLLGLRFWMEWWLWESTRRGWTRGPLELLLLKAFCVAGCWNFNDNVDEGQNEVGYWGLTSTLWCLWLWLWLWSWLWGNIKRVGLDKRSSHNCCYYEPFVLLVIKMLIVMATMKTHKRRYYKGSCHNSLHILWCLWLWWWFWWSTQRRSIRGLTTITVIMSPLCCLWLWWWWWLCELLLTRLWAYCLYKVTPHTARHQRIHNRRYWDHWRFCINQSNIGNWKL